MGEVEYIFGVKIQRDHLKKFLALSQESYITKLFERFNIHNYKSIDTPIAKGECLSHKMCPKTLEEK